MNASARIKPADERLNASHPPPGEPGLFEGVGVGTSGLAGVGVGVGVGSSSDSAKYIRVGICEHETVVNHDL